jgi:beta-lactamase regulating signal transducer with metallopeptidase domain
VSSFLLEIGLTNATLALVMSLVVLLIARWRRNAHLEAVLWLVVLIRFVVPPHVPFSIDLRREFAKVAPPVPSAHAEVLATQTSPHAPVEMGLENTAPSPLSQAANAPTGAALRPTLPRAPERVPVPAQSATVGAQFSLALAALLQRVWSVRALVWLWLGGALLAAATLAARGFRFNRIIFGGGAQEPEVALRNDFEELCRRLRIRRIPRLRVIDAEVSPLIWTWFGRTIVLLPTTLMRRLTHEQRSMVMAHELAHIRRHDHLFRWLEALVQSLYWWLPPVRWIRRRLHTVQDHCCDACVIGDFPDRQAEYCDALLAAANWMMHVRHSPILASEFGRSAPLKERIQAVLHQNLPRPLTRGSWSFCLLIGLFLLTVSVRWIAAEPRNHAQTAIPPTSAHKPQSLSALDRIMDNWKAREQRTRTLHTVWTEHCFVPRLFVYQRTGRDESDFKLIDAPSHCELWLDGEDRFCFETTLKVEPKPTNPGVRLGNRITFDGTTSTDAEWGSPRGDAPRGRIWRGNPKAELRWHGFGSWDGFDAVFLCFRPFHRGPQSIGPQNFRLITNNAIRDGGRFVKIQRPESAQSPIEACWVDPARGDAIRFFERLRRGEVAEAISIQYRQDGSLPTSWEQPSKWAWITKPQQLDRHVVTQIEVNAPTPQGTFTARFPERARVSDETTNHYFTVAADGSKSGLLTFQSVADLRIHAALETRVDFDAFDLPPRWPLRDALDYIATRCQIQIKIRNPGLANAPIDPNTEVSFTAPGITVRELLDRLLGRPARPIAYHIENGVLYIEPTPAAK